MDIDLTEYQYVPSSNPPSPLVGARGVELGPLELLRPEGAFLLARCPYCGLPPKFLVQARYVIQELTCEVPAYYTPNFGARMRYVPGGEHRVSPSTHVPLQAAQGEVLAGCPACQKIWPSVAVAVDKALAPPIEVGEEAALAPLPSDEGEEYDLPASLGDALMDLIRPALQEELRYLDVDLEDDPDGDNLRDLAGQYAAWGWYVADRPPSPDPEVRRAYHENRLQQEEQMAYRGSNLEKLVLMAYLDYDEEALMGALAGYLEDLEKSYVPEELRALEAALRTAFREAHATRDAELKALEDAASARESRALRWARAV